MSLIFYPVKVQRIIVIQTSVNKLVPNLFESIRIGNDIIVSVPLWKREETYICRLAYWLCS